MYTAYGPALSISKYLYDCPRILIQLLLDGVPTELVLNHMTDQHFHVFLIKTSIFINFSIKGALN